MAIFTRACCGLMLVLGVPLLGAGQTHPAAEKTPAVDPRSVHLAFTDGSHLKVMLAEETIELQTPHGKLSFPIGDIQRIEFAQRVSEETSLAIDQDIGKLGHDDYKTREAAMARLLERKEKSFAPLLRAARSQTDAEMRARIDQLVDRLRQTIPEEQLNVRLNDVVYTADSKIAGRLSAGSFKISSAQFGQLQLKLADIRELRSQAAGPAIDEIDPKLIQADPGNMLSHQYELGKTFYYRVTGSQHGTCYGTDVYTTDSSIAAAAVHMGLLKPGETGVMIVSVIASPPAFVSSSRNGVSSSSWSQYTAAYTMKKARLANANSP
ncbi:LCCL domain-containing protein [Anatilimnocola sp. NA78]|uniref:LCCL domain-containing protein n=1 Tax=Anatilimnocola sp. NA78 TaxID=3415683 RepID=UPI003CE58B50